MLKKQSVLLVISLFLVFRADAVEPLKAWEHYNAENRKNVSDAFRYLLHKISPKHFDAPQEQAGKEVKRSAPTIIPTLQELVHDGSPIHEYVRYIRKLDEMESSRIKMARALLLYGPPGTGKTTIAKAVTQELEFDYVEILGSEFASKYMSEEAQSIRTLFAELRESKRKTVLFVDEIDTLGSASGGAEQNVEHQRSLTTFWKELEDPRNRDIYVIAATNRYRELNPALIRSGRFYKHVQIGLPDEPARRKIVEFYLAQAHIQLPAETVTKIVTETQGFSGADLEALVNMVESKILLSHERSEGVLKYWVENELAAKKGQVEQSKQAQTSPLQQALNALSGQSGETSDEAPKCNFRYEKNVRDRFEHCYVGNRPDSLDTIVQYFRNPAAFRRLGADLPRGLLLYGPPGTGKTTIARVLAGESGLDLISLSGSDFAQKYYGEGAKAVRALFAYARDLKKPIIIFIDEIDSVGFKRSDDGNSEDRKILNTLLAELTDDRNDAIFVVGATNSLDALDRAFLRRFNYQEEIELPNEQQRRTIFEFYLLGREHVLDAAAMGRILKKMEANGCSGPKKSFSGSDIKKLVQFAATEAATRGTARLTEGHFNQAHVRIAKTNKVSWTWGQAIWRTPWRIPVIGDALTGLYNLSSSDEELAGKK